MTRELNDTMEFDHVIRVGEDGAVSDAPDGIYAPDVRADSLLVDVDPADWTLMTGYSGQDSYSGPVMHASEFIGGRMECDILANPGLYVAVVVYNADGDEEPDGWAVAYREELGA